MPSSPEGRQLRYVPGRPATNVDDSRRLMAKIERRQGVPVGEILPPEPFNYFESGRHIGRVSLDHLRRSDEPQEGKHRA